VKLFISYSSTRQDLSERLRLALEAEGHEVFADRADLRAGEAFHERLREAIQAAELFIFLISPESVAPGSYTLAELNVAEQRWRVPAGHVLPVVVAPTERASIPPYLLAVTLLQPKGDVVAEVVAAVAALRPKGRRGAIVVALALAAIVLAAGGAYGWRQHQAALAEQREVALEQQRSSAATGLCNGGQYALAWQQFESLAVARPQSAPLAAAREDCGMLWLRHARVTEGKETFGQLADRVQPVLASGLVTAHGRRAADLRAHVAWADFLRGRDGVRAPAQEPQYARAVQDDPTNVYANAMWAHRLLWPNDTRVDEAARHFATALQDGRDRAYVRELQFAAYLGRSSTEARALVVADEMSRGGEAIAPEMRDRLWRDRYAARLIDPGTRAATLAALPPAAGLETFQWLAPAPPTPRDQPQLQFGIALLQANAGDAAAARATLEALSQALRKERAAGRLADETEKLLKAAKR
jgi:hypothetical protein